ncbi:MAG: hypothetical protein CMJ18_03855 [Phycisphaeraceae bacterium]|nr:hypothetical protein [Phycisphaeraceae bacterium]
MNTSRIVCVVVAVAVAMLIVAAPAAAAERSAALLPDPHEMARVEAAVDQSLEYLLSQQHPDGSWPSGKGVNNGVNALCLLAFLGRGHVPARGPYQPVVDRAIAFIVNTQEESGLYRTPNHWNGVMYEHGLCTLAMIEAYGFMLDDQMRRSAQSAVDLIVKVQSPLGGWRYQPVPAQADLSVTVMQVVALRAAQNARLEVPKKTLDAALKYVRACAKDNGFAYQPGGNPSVPQSAAGALSMQLLGAFDDPSVTKALDYLKNWNYTHESGHFWYMNYYAMQANFQAGGAHWDHWHRRVRAFLLSHQRPNGAWPAFKDGQYAGPTECYSTALGAMTLEVYMHYLPAYQR